MTIVQSSACKDPLRAMFFEHVGRFFLGPEKAKPSDPGTRCQICGATDVPLVGPGLCMAQRTITQKRPGREENGSPDPIPDSGHGMNAFTDGSMVIAGPHVRIALSKLRYYETPPWPIENLWVQKGEIARLSRELVLTPPKPPFAVIVFGKKADFRGGVTENTSYIRIAGPEPYDLNVAGAKRLLSLVEGLKVKEFQELLYLKRDLASDGPSEKTKERFEKAKERFERTDRNWKFDLRELHRLPAPGDPVALALEVLLENN
jgi:hypothetical protein